MGPGNEVDFELDDDAAAVRGADGCQLLSQTFAPRRSGSEARPVRPTTRRADRPAILLQMTEAEHVSTARAAYDATAEAYVKWVGTELTAATERPVAIGLCRSPLWN